MGQGMGGCGSTTWSVLVVNLAWNTVLAQAGELQTVHTKKMSEFLVVSPFEIIVLHMNRHLALLPWQLIK